MRMLKAAALGAAIWAGGNGVTTAEAATFQLVDVRFDDGGTATGQFDFDLVAGFTNVSIVTSSNGPFTPGGLYTTDDPVGKLDGEYQAPSGLLAIVFRFDRQCLSAASVQCDLFGYEFDSASESIRVKMAGYAAPIPLPAPLLLFATGLAGVVGFSRAKRRKQRMAQV